MRKVIAMIVAGVVVMFPVADWSLYQWAAVLVPAPSITLVSLLFCSLLSRMGGPVLLRDRDWLAAWGGGVAVTVLLYPTSIGLSAVDLYAWGWSGKLCVAVGIMAVSLILSGNRFGVIVAADLLAFWLLRGWSANLWDVLVDPFFAVASCVAVGIRGIRHRWPGKFRTGRHPSLGPYQ